MRGIWQDVGTDHQVHNPTFVQSIDVVLEHHDEISSQPVRSLGIISSPPYNAFFESSEYH